MVPCDGLSTMAPCSCLAPSVCTHDHDQDKTSDDNGWINVRFFFKAQDISQNLVMTHPRHRLLFEEGSVWHLAKLGGYKKVCQQLPNKGLTCTLLKNIYNTFSTGVTLIKFAIHILCATLNVFLISLWFPFFVSVVRRTLRSALYDPVF